MGAAWAKFHRGGGVSKKAAFYRALRANDELLQQLKSVGLEQPQLHELFRIFSAMDKDNSGEINMMEFFTYIDLTRTRFSEKAFAVMDKDGSGEVDFVEFVLAVWNYCSFTHSSLVRFAFDLYDLDGSGEVEREEAAQCIREVWGSDWESSNIAQKILAKLESIMQNTASGRLSVSLFQDFAARHPMLLFPAFQLQTEIQQKVLGPRFWAQAAKRRGTLDPADFNWGTVDKVAKLSRANSRNLLQAMESDLGEQLDDHLQPKKTSKGGPKSALKRFSSSFSASSSIGAGISQNAGGVGSSDAVTAITTLKATAEPLRPTQRRKRSGASIRSSSKYQDRRVSGQLVVEDMER